MNFVPAVFHISHIGSEIAVCFGLSRDDGTSDGDAVLNNLEPILRLSYTDPGTGILAIPGHRDGRGTTSLEVEIPDDRD